MNTLEKKRKENKLKGNFRGVALFIRVGHIATHDANDADDVPNAREGHDTTDY